MRPPGQAAHTPTPASDGSRSARPRSCCSSSDDRDHDDGPRAARVPAHGLSDFFTSRAVVAGRQLFGALPFIWGTLFTAAIAVAIAVPVSLGVALFITQVAPRRLAHADRLRDRPARGRAVGRVRPVGRAGAVAALPPRPLVHDRRHHPRDHDHADHHVARARGDRDDAADREGSGARARRDPLGDDQGARCCRTARAASSAR